MNRYLAVVALVGVLVAGCGSDDLVVAEGIFAELGAPIPSASGEQLATFERGRTRALKRFTAADGLGPSFNVTACAACHERPTAGGSSPRYRNFLLVAAELSDGTMTPTGINGVQPQYTLGDGGRFPSDPATTRQALRNAIPFFGVGLLAEIPESEILRYADEDDSNDDGISGRPNFDRGFVGRFGRKAQTVSIEGFIRGPLFNHLGITSNPLSDEFKARLPVPSAAPSANAVGALRGDGVASATAAQVSAPEEPNMDTDGVSDPELSEQELFDLVSFSMLLAAPQPDEPTADSEAGRRLFEQINCSGCHRPALAGPRGLIPAYTDLLLHDMGEDLADNVLMGVATASEFRTHPLWGVVATGPYLHDGRAETLDEAIRLHGGEASAVRDRYLELTEDERGSILAFLASLGGASQASPGLLPPDAPIPAADEYGGAADGTDLDMFEIGRAVFDRNFAPADGLGTNFNGDSCRACHFDPVIGGSGPADVNVNRHGFFNFETGDYMDPAQGTMAHRQSVDPVRPAIDEEANFFEQRQTPPLFGLGLAERVPDATIIDRQDPDDVDGDGISGRAHILPDGRLGRLGWKANVPTLQEFARDGLLNELGITLPEEPDQTFGAGSDDDAVADPEIDLADLQALVFYMEHLAPPPRSSTDATLEAQGANVFESLACTSCHVPELEAEDGTPVPVYSDFLLHDIAAEGSGGIQVGDAAPHEFRTAPLWGLATTSPYMHSGRAFSIEEAIAEHFGEAETSRLDYEALNGTDRAALLAFLGSL